MHRSCWTLSPRSLTLTEAEAPHAAIEAVDADPPLVCALFTEVVPAASVTAGLTAHANWVPTTLLLSVDETHTLPCAPVLFEAHTERDLIRINGYVAKFGRLRPKTAETNAFLSRTGFAIMGAPISVLKDDHRTENPLHRPLIPLKVGSRNIVDRLENT